MTALRLLFIVAVSLSAQPAFEVASIKPTPPERRNQLRLDYCLSDGSYSVAGIPIFWSLKYAFGLRDYQIQGTPRWATEFDSAYDIEARPSTSTGNTQCREMLQALFADRFALSVHRETREQPVLLLTLDPHGRKFSVGGGVQLNGVIQLRDDAPEFPDGWTMAELAAYLSDIIQRPVLDRTELAGKFGIRLNFSRTEGADGAPTIFTAVREQLGLNLEAAKAPVETLIIDHIERPSGN